MELFKNIGPIHILIFILTVSVTIFAVLTIKQIIKLHKNNLLYLKTKKYHLDEVMDILAERYTIDRSRFTMIKSVDATGRNFIYSLDNKETFSTFNIDNFNKV